jgi:hypothetical protein
MDCGGQYMAYPLLPKPVLELIILFSQMSAISASLIHKKGILQVCIMLFWGISE